MIQRRTFLFSALALALAGAWTTGARADDVADTFAEIKKAREKVKTLVATFTQERTIGLLSSTVKSEGEMTLVRPDRLRWELKPPDAITYWVTPEGLAFSTPSGGAAVGKGAAGKFGAVLNDLMTFLGGDLEKLRARYDITVPSREGGIVLRAEPKADDVKKHVKALTLSIGPDFWTVRSLVIEENTGDKSVITFGKVTRDVQVDPVKMTPPKQR